MNVHSLGRTSLQTTPLGLGTWAMGAGKGGTSNLGAQDDAASIAAIHRGLELGYNWIDTAPYYGFGHAEDVVGRALDGVADRPYVFTKCGMVPAPPGHDDHFKFDLSPASIRAEVEASLRRLRTDVIDLLQVHWPIPDEDLEAAWTEMASLQRAGKVRYLGTSNFSVEQLERCERIAPVATAQPQYSLVDRAAEETFPYCVDQGIAVIVYSPLKHGLLSGTMTRERAAGMAATDWRNGHPDYVEPQLSRNLRIVDELRAIGKRHGGRSPAEVAIAWTLCQPAVAGAIVGGRNPEQVEASTGAADVRLEEQDLAALERVAARVSA